MSTLANVLLRFQVLMFIGVPVIGWVLVLAFGAAGITILTFLIFLWCWQLFTFFHYRSCRQEEFLYVLQTAAATNAPVEAVLRAYVRDRPKEHLYRGALLLFIFPGYYWYHFQRSFDARLTRLANMLDNGIPLDHAVSLVPGVMSRENALAITVGQYSARLPYALQRLPDQRLAHQWLELAFRLAYPLMVLLVMVSIVSFVMIFIIPKFERIFADFKMKLPYVSELLIAGSRRAIRYTWIIQLLWLSLLALFNYLILSSYAKWYCPLVGWVYRLHTRGHFLQLLGFMLETGKPLPAILDCVLDSKLLPTVLNARVERLTDDVRQGRPLAESLIKHQLATETMGSLIASAEKAQNLPWALQELGDSLLRRSARLSHLLATVLFPLAIFACAALIAIVAIAMFSPLAALIEGVSGN